MALNYLSLLSFHHEPVLCLVLITSEAWRLSSWQGLGLWAGTHSMLQWKLGGKSRGLGHIDRGHLPWPWRPAETCQRNWEQSWTTVTQPSFDFLIHKWDNESPLPGWGRVMHLKQLQRWRTFSEVLILWQLLDWAHIVYQPIKSSSKLQKIGTSISPFYQGVNWSLLHPDLPGAITGHSATSLMWPWKALNPK